MARRLRPGAALATVILAACGGAAKDTSDATAPPGVRSTASTTPAAVGAVDDEPATTGTPSTSATDDGEFDAEPFEVDQVSSSPRDVTTSGLDAARNGFLPTDAPDPLVDVAEIRSGGPPPDGIPPIDRPTFLGVGDVGFLADNEPVLALEIDGDARAYPVQILTWHEIVNDTVGGIPVAVSYCPLCNSAVAYDRRVRDLVLDFGTSGMLYNSALVMYDRQTETLWSHFTGEGVVGELTGVDLEAFPLATVAWGTFRDAHPDGLVLSRDTGFSREYGRNPYPGYDRVDGVPFLFQGEVDGRYTALTRIIGIESGDAALGIPLLELRQAEVLTGEIGGDRLVAFWAAGTSSALDSQTIADGVDVGSTGVFVPANGSTELTFTAVGDGTFIDAETGSTWNVLGEAIDGELAGAGLDPYLHVDTFWFAWSTFRSDTELLTR